MVFHVTGRSSSVCDQDEWQTQPTRRVRPPAPAAPDPNRSSSRTRLCLADPRGFPLRANEGVTVNIESERGDNVDMSVQRLYDEPGTLQSSKISSAVLDPLMPSLSSFCAVEKPGIPFIERKKGMKGEKTLTISVYSTTCTYLFHNESWDASLIGFGIRLCVNNEDVGVRPVRDPELVSVQDVVVAFRKHAPHNVQL